MSEPLPDAAEIMRLADEYGDTCDGRFEVRPEERDNARAALEAKVNAMATEIRNQTRRADEELERSLAFEVALAEAQETIKRQVRVARKEEG